jgi:glycine cleavage system H lipoate-binding protein
LQCSYLTFRSAQVLEDTPGTVNESPLQKGWFIKLKVSAAGKAEYEKLLDDKAYKAHTEADAH